MVLIETILAFRQLKKGKASGAYGITTGLAIAIDFRNYQRISLLSYIYNT